MLLALLVGLPHELAIDVRPVEGKGLGAFAQCQIPSGAFVCRYAGERISRQQVVERHTSSPSEYLFDCGGGDYVDATHSSHPSRFINHAEEGNLIPSPDLHGDIHFYAARDIDSGEELCFDCESSAHTKRFSRTPCVARAFAPSVRTCEPHDTRAPARRRRRILDCHEHRSTLGQRQQALADP
jgi:hypothetical protein